MTTTIHPETCAKDNHLSHLVATHAPGPAFNVMSVVDGCELRKECHFWKKKDCVDLPMFAHNNPILVDKVVKCLTTAWRQDVVPEIFRVIVGNQHQYSSCSRSNTLAPNPRATLLLPSSHLSEIPRLSSPQSHIPSTQYNDEISAFVYDILHKTWTTEEILQDAFHHLEKLREKLPELSKLRRPSELPEEGSREVEGPEDPYENFMPALPDARIIRYHPLTIHDQPNYFIDPEDHAIGVSLGLVEGQGEPPASGNDTRNNVEFEWCLPDTYQSTPRTRESHHLFSEVLSLPQTLPCSDDSFASIGDSCAYPTILPSSCQFSLYDAPQLFDAPIESREFQEDFDTRFAFSDACCSTPKAYMYSKDDPGPHLINPQTTSASFNTASGVPRVGKSANSTRAIHSLEKISPLPSPLFCPRRMFLAALILATKFHIDVTHTNLSWAIMCGLELQEVNRSERALGEALEWRLWVKCRAATILKSTMPKRGRTKKKSTRMHSKRHMDIVRSQAVSSLRPER